MNTTVRNFERPQGLVYFSAINIDVAKCTFSMQYAFVPKGKRKVVLNTVSGTITPELKEWLAKVFAEKVVVMENDQRTTRETGRNITGFQLFLDRISEVFTPGILSTLTFKSENNSEDYYSNPFKLVMLNDKNVLTLVNVAPKAKSMKFNPTTGKTDIYYTQRYFKVGEHYRKSYVPKKHYTRLILQQDKLMEVAPPMEATQQSSTQPTA